MLKGLGGRGVLLDQRGVCWVTSSICDSALLTCSMSVDCSALAAAISATIAAKLLIDSRISASAEPA
jgi:hypothetical protein